MGYSYKTEKSYAGLVKRFILFHNKRHPSEMGKIEIEQFLTHLAVDRKVSPSTQNQAFNALVFLYKQVLSISLEDAQISAIRAKQKIRVPVVLSKDEVKTILFHTSGVYQLMLMLLYDCGLRMSELLRLRIKDIDFSMSNVYVYDSKSKCDRVISIPKRAHCDLMIHIKYVEKVHQADLQEGLGYVDLLFGLERKYPNANREFKWQFLFPMKKNFH